MQPVVGDLVQLRDGRWITWPPTQLRRSTATVVDYVIPITEGGRDDWHNLQSLCNQRHAVKATADAQIDSVRPR